MYKQWIHPCSLQIIIVFEILFWPWQLNHFNFNCMYVVVYLDIMIIKYIVYGLWCSGKQAERWHKVVGEMWQFKFKLASLSGRDAEYTKQKPVSFYSWIGNIGPLKFMSQFFNMFTGAPTSVQIFVWTIFKHFAYLLCVMMIIHQPILLSKIILCNIVWQILCFCSLYN